MTSIRQREKAQRQAQRVAERAAREDLEARRTAHIYDGVRMRIAAIRDEDRQEEAWRRLGETLAKFNP